jgi:dihydrofolate synthase / folylpolyglutamate synthase
MNYRESLEFLRQKGNEVQMMHLGLHRTCAMMQALDNPQDKYPSIHIAGTNGKGSVAAMSESILRRAGLVTGLYTSPHLVRVEERIRINGRQVSPRSFAALATRIRNVETALLRKEVLDRPLTTFEFLTCCAFLHFAVKKIDIAVIEVGLGGKLDATNVIYPEVSVITGIALDHQNYLGNTLTLIAGEKAGIIKERIPAISGCGDPVPLRVIRNQAKTVKAPLLEMSRDFHIRNIHERRGLFAFDLQTPCRTYRNLRLSLAGAHQTRNAALAIMAIESMKSFHIKADDIRRGLSETRWLGRLDEYGARRRTLLDGAHNPEGAKLLREYLTARKETEIHLVFGAVRDKDIHAIGAALFPIASAIHLTPLVNTRSADPAEVALMHPRCRSRMIVYKNMRDALYAAWKECPLSGLVVVTGSLYLVGDLLPLVQKDAGVWPEEKRHGLHGFHGKK